jgi:hypothetical protein
VNRQQAADYIRHGSQGRIVALEFRKRSDNSLREMRCRSGVYSHLTGGTPSYSAEDKGLIVVFDMEKRAYRSIPIDGLQRVKIKGQWVQIEQGESS